jgi:hypothetical protein
MDGTWVQVQQPDDGAFLPSPRSGHSTWYYDGAPYIYGGLGADDNELPEDEGRSFYNDVLAPIPGTDSWVHVPTAGESPRPTFGQSHALLGDTVFVYGGQTEVLDQVCSDVHLLHMPTLTWRSVDYALAPGISSSHMDRWGTSAVPYYPAPSAKPIALLFAGACSNDEHCNDVMTFDPASGLFSCVTTMGNKPSKRRRHGAAIFENRLMFITGGRESRFYKNDTWMLYLPTMSWVHIDCSMTPPLMFAAAREPNVIVSNHAVAMLVESQKSLKIVHECKCTTVQPRTGLSSVIRGTSLFVVTGFSQTTRMQIPTLYSDVHEYDLTTCEWRRLKCFHEEGTNVHTDGPEYDSNVNTVRQRSALLSTRDTSTYCAPIGRSMGSLDVDPKSGDLVLFGGRDNVGALGDMWRLTLIRSPSLVKECIWWVRATQPPETITRSCLPAHLNEVLLAPKKTKCPHK